jgi:hypothetical protein
MDAIDIDEIDTKLEAVRAEVVAEFRRLAERLSAARIGSSARSCRSSPPRSTSWGGASGSGFGSGESGDDAVLRIGGAA